MTVTQSLATGGAFLYSQPMADIEKLINSLAVAAEELETAAGEIEAIHFRAERVLAKGLVEEALSSVGAASLLASNTIKHMDDPDSN